MSPMCVTFQILSFAIKQQSFRLPFQNVQVRIIRKETLEGISSFVDQTSYLGDLSSLT